MLNKEILNLNNLKAINEVFKRLNCMRRWTSVTSDSKYNELSKQALNCIIAYMLATNVEEHGNTIFWERFPKIALYRSFEKSYVFFDTAEHIINEICNIGNIPKSAFDTATLDIIQELTNKVFSNFICEGIGTYEMDIYRAATKVATLIELHENALMKDIGEYTDKFLEIQKSLEQFQNIPGISEFSDIHGKYFKLFSKMSKLRNQNRWSVQPYLANCSVLGHLFDTGMLAYLIGLEYFNGDEKASTKMFFKGIFHDLGETWTTDIPSPIKYRIPGFKAAVDMYEKQVLEHNCYSKIPTYMGEKIKKLLEDDELHSLLKSADYLSADSECWRQYVSGCRDPYFLEAIKKYSEKLNNNIFQLPPTCRELHNYFLTYCTKAVECEI